MNTVQIYEQKKTAETQLINVSE